ncbi:MAG: cell division protein FtsL [Candidatus Poribacteria bacterium]|nr:cell division protein FtsL [Candidatus Poribacteria bacterium]
MQTPDIYSTRTTKVEEPKPKKRFPLVYVVLGLSFCAFAGSIWFSSYAKNVALLRQPVYERQKHSVQDEIHQLELEESALTRIQRVQQIATELKMVEPTDASQIVWDK